MPLSETLGATSGGTCIYYSWASLREDLGATEIFRCHLRVTYDGVGFCFQLWFPEPLLVKIGATSGGKLGTTSGETSEAIQAITIAYVNMKGRFTSLGTMVENTHSVANNCK